MLKYPGIETPWALISSQVAKLSLAAMDESETTRLNFCIVKRILC